MNRQFLFLFFLMTLSSSLFSQSATINNIQVSGRTDGSGYVDIYYNLQGPASIYYISMEASFNNGTTFAPIASTFLSGNVGAVAPGNNLHIIWNGNGSNNNTYSTQTKVKLNAGPFTTGPCGQSFTISHVAGAVAPVSKTVVYGTVAGIPGEAAKCWITSNLGSDHQATAVNDATEPSAGWYWQFNRKQGYKQIWAAVTPAWTITNINESSNWITANDPCNLELGTAWRLPTYTEWYNVDYSGGWTNWSGPWNSALKLHAAGYLHYSDGNVIGRGSGAHYWSGIQDSSTGGRSLNFDSSHSSIDNSRKSYGYSMRCLRNY